MPIALMNDALDDPLEIERVEEFRGGSDGYNPRTLLPANASQALVNMIVEDNGVARSRAGAEHFGTSPADADMTHLLYYDTPTPTELLLASSGDTLFQSSGGDWTPVNGWPLSAYLQDWAQGANLVYLTDGVAQWFSYDGSTFTGLGSVIGQLGGPPVGATLMTWHTERMFAAGISAAPDTIYASSLGDAGASGWNHTSFSFRVGRGEGQRITALCPAKGWWLAVGKEQSIYMVNANPTATTAADWEIRRLSDNVGCVSKKGMILFGDELHVFTRDGVRVISSTPLAEDTPWQLGAPISEPLQAYVNRINWSAGSTICGVKYRHLALWAVPLDSETRPNCVLVWNGRTRTWQGVWTGWSPAGWCVSQFSDTQRLLWADTSSRIGRWLDTESRELATTFKDFGAAFGVTLTTRGFLFGSPIHEKDGELLEIRFVETEASVSVAVYFDEVLAQTIIVPIGTSSNQLPVDLPFDLSVAAPYKLTRNLAGLPSFNECYLEISADSGRVGVKNITLAAFLNSMDSE